MFHKSKINRIKTDDLLANVVLPRDHKTMLEWDKRELLAAGLVVEMLPKVFYGLLPWLS